MCDRSCLNGGGKSRIAPVVTALLVFSMCAFAYPVLNYIPLSSLVGIMLIVIIHTFKCKRARRSSNTSGCFC